MALLGMQGNIKVVDGLAEVLNEEYYEPGHETCIALQRWIFLRVAEWAPEGLVEAIAQRVRVDHRERYSVMNL
jgi:hypothetical protein